MSTSRKVTRLSLAGLALLAVLDVVLLYVALSTERGDHAPPRQPVGASSGSQVARTSTPTTTATATASNTSRTTAPPLQHIELEPLFHFAETFETVRIQGRCFGSHGRTTLQVQLEQHGSWVSLPLPATTDRSGFFSAYVELGKPGQYLVRVVDRQAATVSNVVFVNIS